MTGINTNTAALMAKTYGQLANQKILEPMKRLSSGLRVNSASDDAAGMAVGNKMLSSMRSYEMGVRNSVDMIGLLSTAEGALGEITNIQLRMRELAVQASNGTYTNSDRDKMEHEILDLIAEMDRIAANTKFNDVVLFDGSFHGQIVQTGKDRGDHVRIDIDRLDSCDLGRFWESYTYLNGDFESGGSVTQTGEDVYEINGWEVHNKRIELGEEAQGDEPAADSPATIFNRDGDEVDNLIGGWAIPRDPTPRPFRNAINVLVNPAVSDTINDGALTYDTVYTDVPDPDPPDDSDPGIFDITIGPMTSVSIVSGSSTSNGAIMGQTFEDVAATLPGVASDATFNVTVGGMTVTPTDATSTTNDISLMDQSFDETVGDTDFRVTIGEMTFTPDGASSTTDNTNIMGQTLNVSADLISDETPAEFRVTIGPMTVSQVSATSTTDNSDLVNGSWTNVVSQSDGSGTGAEFDISIGEISFDLNTTSTADGERFGRTYRNVTASAPADAGGQAAVFDITIDSLGNITSTLVDAGSGYLDNESLTISGASIGGDAGSDDLDLTANAAQISVTLADTGSDYVFGETITILGSSIGGDDGADDIQVTVNRANVSVVTTDPGAGYGAGASVTILGSELGGVDGQDDIDLVVGDAEINVSVINSGSGHQYDAGDVVTIPIGDSGETVDVTVNTASVSVSLVDPGEGYKIGENITIPIGGEGDTVVVNGNDPTVVVDATGGSGYIVGENVTFEENDIAVGSNSLVTEVVKVPPGTDDSSRPVDFGDLGNDSETGFTVENGVMKLNTGSMTSTYGFDIAHGPYIISTEAKQIDAGETVFFDWKASGTNDAFDIFAYLLNVDTGETQIMLDETQENAGSTDWATVETTVEADGNYKYVFINGTYDATGGKLLGAEMYIDNIYINRQSLPAEQQHTLCDVSIQTVDEANNAISVIDLAISQISSQRAKYGALINRLRQSVEISSSMGDNLRQARSRVFDAEYALETSQLAKYQILASASMAMLAQANQGDRTVLKLLI